MIRTTSSLAVLAPMGVEAWALRSGLDSARVICTGIGRRKSRAIADRLHGGRARVLAVAGLCGAIDRGLVAGDVIVASELRGDGEVRSLPGASALVDALERIGIPSRMGRIQSEDHVVTHSERRELQASGAIAVDMESAWLAEAAGDRPFAVVRIVLDTPGRELLRPGIILDGMRALGKLRRVAPALEAWSVNQSMNYLVNQLENNPINKVNDRENN